MSYSDLITEVSGKLRLLYSSLVVDDIIDMVVKLVDESLTRWSISGWSRYSDLENDCTSRLVYFALEARREVPSLILCEVHFDSPLLTNRMLEGKAPTVLATRPDLRVHVGDAGISIECKRLGTDSSQPRKYVSEGINRFVTGDYAVPNSFGIMVGYVQQGNPHRLLGAINSVIDNHSAMGSNHRLVPLSWAQRYRSSHELPNTRPKTGPIRLEHFLPYLS